MSRALAAARRFSARIASINNSSAWRYERRTNSGTNARMSPGKRAGRGSMAVSQFGDAINLSVTPASSSQSNHHGANGQSGA